MAVLEKRIRWLENYPHCNIKADDSSIKALKDELAALRAEDEQQDKLRQLPLYSSKITGFKFVCSSCYDILDSIAREEEKGRKKKA